MTAPTAPELTDDDRELTRLLTDRAAAIEPRGTTPALLARRASRVRHRRRATFAGVGLAATAIVASVVVTRSSTTDDGQRVETGIADDGTAAPDGSLDVSTTDQLTFLPIVPTTAPPAEGPPVRLGLDVAGAQVTTAGESPGGGALGIMSTGVDVAFVGPDADRWIRVSAIFLNGTVMGDDLLAYADPPPEQFDLGDGVVGKLTRIVGSPEDYPEVPGYPMPELNLSFEDGDAALHVSGEGVTDEELLRLARDIEIGSGPALVLGWVPDDLTPSEPTNPIHGGPSGASSHVSYVLPDGLSVSISVRSAGGEIFDDDLKHTRAAPTSTQFLRTVRGADAIVRRAAGTTSVLWREPRGHLVEVYISQTLDHTVVPDESIVDTIVELDDATFEELAAAHPMVTTPHPPQN
jgi:hypothetical protein